MTERIEIDTKELIGFVYGKMSKEDYNHFLDLFLIYDTTLHKYKQKLIEKERA